MITEANFQTIVATMLADGAVLLQQIEAMDAFDEGFDALTDEMEAKLTLINWQLPDLMHFAGAHTGSDAEDYWVPVRAAIDAYMQQMVTLTEKIQLANALRGREA